MKGKEKSVQIVFSDKGGAELDYFLGDDQVGSTVVFEKVPKRLRFFLEKFPTSQEDLEKIKEDQA